MMKSTYKGASSTPTAAPLPEGWTEHKAPTGTLILASVVTGHPLTTIVRAGTDPL